MVGGAASFTVKDRIKLLAELSSPLRKGADVVNDGEPSRWNSAADKRWIPIRPEKVAEVAYDQMEVTPGGNASGTPCGSCAGGPTGTRPSCTFDQPMFR